MAMEFITTLPEKKRKRYNKNKKKAWRKKVDMKDVEEGLEEERQEERYGGPLCERESAELMFLDVGDGKTCDIDGKTEIIQEKPVINEIKSDNVLKPSKKKRSSAPLRCHQLLSGLGGAKDPKRGKRNKVKVPQAKMNPITQKKVALESQSVKSQRKLKRLIATREEIKKKKLNKPQSNRLTDYSKDLWEEEKSLDTVEESFLKDCIKFRDSVTQKSKIKIPLTRDKKTTALPALAVPLPGQSYNPRYEDHQRLMKQAIGHEEIKQDRIEKPKRTTDHMFPAVGTHNTAKTWMKEMSEGLPTGGSTKEKEVDYEEVIDEVEVDNDEWEDLEEEDVENEDENESVEDEDENESDEDETESVKDEAEDDDDEDEEFEEKNENSNTDENEIELESELTVTENTIVNDGESKIQEQEELRLQISKSDKSPKATRKGIKRSIDENTESSKKNIEPNNNSEDELKIKRTKKEIQKLMTVSSGGTNNPKPAQQRRKEIEQKLLAQERTKEKELKHRESQVFRVKSLEKEIAEMERKKAKKKVKREEKMKNEMYKPQRMSYFRYREHDLAIALGDELTDSLRSIKPKSNLMEEHFNRMQKRNMIETRIKRKIKRKPKRMIKRDQKPDYSMVDKFAKES